MSTIESPDDAIDEASQNNADEMAGQLMAKGILELYEPPLVTINTHLKELTDKQDAVHNIMVSARRRLEDTENDATLDALLADVATSKERLNSISNSMMSLHKRVQSLQARAANIDKVAKSKAASPTKSNNS
ncbi:unnamed protein product [Leptosia nina]|uniref:Biogenesis of lysosome-related organelles complex 1 subunit 7 n=1 Tax=Leptosia nina TaxID=320188 RepID=A0AAV1J1J7_9NEOP